MAHRDDPNDMDAYLREAAADEDVRALARCTLDLPDAFSRSGVVAVFERRVWFLQSDPFGVTVAREWALSDLGGLELRAIDGTLGLVFRVPEGTVKATGFADEEVLRELYGALTAGTTPARAVATGGGGNADSPGPPAPSPASHARAGTTVLAVGALALVFTGGVVAYLLASESTPGAGGRRSLDPPPSVDLRLDEPSTLTEVAPAEVEQEVRETAPHGLKGLSFGMTEDEVRAELPEMMEATPGPVETVSSSVDLSQTMPLTELPFVQVVVPGEVWQITSTVGGDPATCYLHFAVNDRLSRMRCALDPLPSIQRHEEVEQALIQAIVRRYGAPDSAPSKPGDTMDLAGFGMIERRWRWADDAARLEVHSSYLSLVDSSEIEMDNSSVEHDREAAERQAEADRLLAEQVAQREREREAECRAARERAGDRARALDEDL